MTTRVSTVADGVTTLYSIPFPYLDRAHVKVMLDGVTQSPSTYSWVTEGSIQFIVAPGAGVKVTRYRETPSTPLTIYQSGSVLTRDQLEVDSLQALYRTEEAEEVALRLPEDHSADTLLPTLVPLAPLVVNADASGFSMGDTELTGDLLLRPDLAAGTDDLHSNPETGGVDRGIVPKLREVISAEDFGAVGDGITDDNTALTNAAAAAVARGRVLDLDGTKTYAIGLQWAIPAGAKIRTNGATLLDLNGTASNSPLITVSDNVWIDVLRARIPAGKTRERVVVVTGDDFVCGRVHITADEQQANTTDNDDGALRLLDADRVKIGHVVVAGFDRPLLIDGTVDATIGGLTISNYVTGLWSVDNRNLAIGPSRIHTASPNAIYSPGHVGVLLSASATDLSRNIALVDFNIEDAGEHGIRVGGPEQQSNIYLVRPRIKNVGGSGIKILGTDSGTPTVQNKRIYIIDPVIEDCGSGSLTTNMCGILVMFCDDVRIVNPVIRKESKAFSGSSGIRFAGTINDCVVVAPDVRSAELDGIYLDGSLGNLTRIRFSGGGFSFGNGRDGWRFAIFSSAVESIVMDAPIWSLNNAGVGFTWASAGGGGVVGRPSLKFKVGGNTGGAGACDSNAVALQVEGGPGATPLSGIFCRNGSQWNDETTLNIRKAGAWTAL